MGSIGRSSEREKTNSRGGVFVVVESEGERGGGHASVEEKGSETRSDSRENEELRESHFGETMEERGREEEQEEVELTSQKSLGLFFLVCFRDQIFTTGSLPTSSLYIPFSKRQEKLPRAETETRASWVSTRTSASAHESLSTFTISSNLRLLLRSPA